MTHTIQIQCYGPKAERNLAARCQTGEPIPHPVFTAQWNGSLHDEGRLVYLFFTADQPRFDFVEVHRVVAFDRDRDEFVRDEDGVERGYWYVETERLDVLDRKKARQGWGR